MPTSFKQQLTDYWSKATPKKRNMTLLAGVASLMVVGALVVDAGNGPGGPQRKAPAEPSRTQLMLPRAQDHTLETVAATGQATSNEVSRLSAELQHEKEDKELLLKRIDDDKNNRKPDAVTADLLNIVEGLKKRIDDVEASKAVAPASPSLNDPLPTPGASSASDAASEPARPAVGSRLHVGGDTKVAEKKAPVKEAEPIAYLTPGTFLEATLLNGMDAPTNSVAQKNPIPSVLRVKSEAMGPNHFSHDVRECFILVSGYGVLSSERAQLRTETLSCVKEDGTVIEAKMDGYVVGEDGRVGPRGRLVSKQGQMIAKSLAAGVLSGFGEALTPTAIPQLNLSGSSTLATATPSVKSVGETGLARGFSDASKAASGFFLEMAREMTPVVEIDAGRKVTVVLIKGLELK